MTRAECTSRRDDLVAKRDALVDQIAEADAQSATLSSGGGSKSFTNRSVADLKAKVVFLNREIAKLNARLGLCADPSAIKTIVPRYF